MKKLFQILGIIIVVLGFIKCDIIDEPDRIKEERKEVPWGNDSSVVQKTVLLMDFTDQRCLNCPEAANMIKNFINDFGSDLIAVSIHAVKPYNPQNPFYSLVTTAGNEYEDYFNGWTGHPKGSVDGEKSIDRGIWLTAIMSRFEVEPPLQIELECKYNSKTETATVNSKITSFEDTENLMFMLWVTESNIVDYQLMLDGSSNWNYVHNHVFRFAINDTWGEEIEFEICDSCGSGNVLEKTHSFTLKDLPVYEKRDLQEISIIGFVYNSKTFEVYQTTEIHLLNNIEEHN